MHLRGLAEKGSRGWHQHIETDFWKAMETTCSFGFIEEINKN